MAARDWESNPQPLTESCQYSAYAQHKFNNFFFNHSTKDKLGKQLWQGFIRRKPGLNI